MSHSKIELQPLWCASPLSCSTCTASLPPGAVDPAPTVLTIMLQVPCASLSTAAMLALVAKPSAMLAASLTALLAASLTARLVTSLTALLVTALGMALLEVLEPKWRMLERPL